jgi:hypothetical protein
MTLPGAADVTIVTAPAAAGETNSYVDWPAIIAGVVLASAISIVLLTFGSAVGLGFADFRGREGVSPIWIAVAAASWLLWVQISSFMAGGYLTGRLRRRIGDASEHEVDVRDGAHGLLVWGGALVVGAIIAVSGLGAAANAVGAAAATVTQAASNVAGGTAELADPNAYFVDALFRAPPAAAGAPVPTNNDAARAEAGRILASGMVSGDGSADDRAYLAQLIAQNTGLAPADAQVRVDQVMAKVDEAKAQALAVAETARRTGVIAAFLVAASLLVSAIGAYWAASIGGRHRDEGTVFANVFRRY